MQHNIRASGLERYFPSAVSHVKWAEKGLEGNRQGGLPVRNAWLSSCRSGMQVFLSLKPFNGTS